MTYRELINQALENKFPACDEISENKTLLELIVITDYIEGFEKLLEYGKKEIKMCCCDALEILDPDYITRNKVIARMRSENLINSEMCKKIRYQTISIIEENAKIIQEKIKELQEL